MEKIRFLFLEKLENEVSFVVRRISWRRSTFHQTLLGRQGNVIATAEDRKKEGTSILFDYE